VGVENKETKSHNLSACWKRKEKDETIELSKRPKNIFREHLQNSKWESERETNAYIYPPS
jgi:hypothetical protein